MEETPFNIIPRRNISGIEIEYKSIAELGQGGPEVGNLYIGGKIVSSCDRFGAPLLKLDEYIYVPAYVRGFWKSGFRLAKIDIKSKQIKYISKKFPLITRLQKNDNTISFFINAEGTGNEILIVDIE